jgi:rubrerythrin
MITGKVALLDAMIEAYIMEKGINAFYLEASAKAKNGTAKKAFGELAKWEEEHMYYIQFLYQAIQGDTDLMSFEEFKKKLKPDAVEGGIPASKLKEKLKKFPFIDDSGAIAFAINVEGRAYNLYRRLSTEATDTNTKAFMKDLMQWEKKHIAYLMELRGKIAKTP